MAPGRIDGPCSDVDGIPSTISPAAGGEDLDLLEPIAVIGFAFKFPQDATSSAGFWKILQEKINTMTEVPSDRFNIDTLYHPSKWNSLPLRGGNFLKEDISRFDAEFFGINPTEAVVMDPAQRILLETTYHAFEGAGLRVEDLRGSNTSVHTGCFTSDYMQQLLADSERPPSYSAVGGTLSMLANRLSWFYDLMGPSVNMDSACSSSAMAIDQACQLLRSGEARLGVAAGCNLTIDPQFTNLLANMQFLSKDSRSYSFDSRANGYARGEGVAVVLLQTLSQALRDGNTIRCIIRASGSNQDGRTPTVTQPNSKAQIQLIKETYRKAGLEMQHTRFFEAHGTGTAVGDPIEARAIQDVFKQHRSRQSPLYVGALKSNIGHLEGASGIAALIKVILMLEKGTIVPNANFENLNPKLVDEETCLVFPSSSIPWPTTSHSIRRASINCFGYGGSNCHLIVDDAMSFLDRRGLHGRHNTLPEPLDSQNQSATLVELLEASSLSNLDRRISQQTGAQLSPPRLLVWSATTEAQLNSVISSWQDHFVETSTQSEPKLDVDDLAYTLGTRRSRLPWRSYAVVSSAYDLGLAVAKASRPTRCLEYPLRPAFVFTGQGAQWFAMGRELLQYSRFSQVVEEAEATLQVFGCTWSVRGELLKSEAESQINEPQIAQPLCAILQVGIVDLLHDAGVVPSAVVGHSMGEIAAAYCAGAISRTAAFRIAYFRGAYIAEVPARTPICGSMMAVGLSPDSIQPYFNTVSRAVPNFNLSLACINSPKSVTVSGESDQLTLLETELKSSSVFFRRLRVNAAYHSPQLECIAQDCLDHFQSLEAGKSQNHIPMVSTISAAVIPVEELRRPEYWVKNMLSPVEFSDAVKHLFASDDILADSEAINHLIEIGPHATLKMPIQEILQDLPGCDKVSYSSVLYRGKPATASLLQMVGDLFSLGYPVNLRSINDPHQLHSPSVGTLVDVPKYPFNHDKSYWYESQLTLNQRFRKHKHLPLLGSTATDSNALRPQWRYVIRQVELPWLRDHRLDGSTVYPASAYISMALAAASQQSHSMRPIRAYVVRQVSFRSPIVPPLGSDEMETRLNLSPVETAPNSSKWVWQFDIFSSRGTDWSEACTGMVEAVYDQDPSGERVILRQLKARLSDARSRCTEESDSHSVYKALERCGYRYGPTLQGMQKVRHNCNDLASARIALDLPWDVDRDNQDYIIHPATLDSFSQLSLVALTSGATAQELLHVPKSIKKLWISADGVKTGEGFLQASVKLEQISYRSRSFSLFALNEQESAARIVLDGLELSPIIGHQSRQRREASAVDSPFKFRNIVDVETLSTAELHEWLSQECGPDVDGPSEFWNDLRLYTRLVLLDVQSKYKDATAIPKKHSHFSNYLSWIDWQLSHTTSRLSEDTTHQALEDRLHTRDGVGRLIVEVARNIRKVLDGELDVLQLLFGDSLLNDFYRDQACGSVYEEKLKRYVRQLAMKRSRMNILEIGGGTGSFTKHILSALESSNSQPHLYNEYTFTDISPKFFENAKANFPAHQKQMSFKRLDIGADLVEQGYLEGCYDLIVASNVLHVTSDISGTVSAVRKLLKPGGKLLLHETDVPENVEVGFAFGIIQGWWAGTEHFRSMSPLITRDRWISILQKNSFSSPDIIIQDFKDEDSHHFSIYVASAVEVSELRQANRDVTIITDGEGCPESVLVAPLQQALSVNGVHASLMPLAASLYENLNGKTVILLIDAVDSFFSKMSEDRFGALKAVLSSVKAVLWVTGGASNESDPAFGMINGFSQVLRLEYPDLDVSTLALSTFDMNDDAIYRNSRHIANAFWQVSSSHDRFDRENYLVEDDKLTIRRASLDEQIAEGLSDLEGNKITKVQTVDAARPFAVKATMSSEKICCEILKESNASCLLAEDEVEIDVCAVGLGQMDLRIQYGAAAQDSLGSQGCGIVKAAGSGLSLQPGDRVCFWRREALRSTVRAKANLVARLPEPISFTEAAKLPTDYLTASYLLNDYLKLRPNSRILILARNNGLGRAAIEQVLQLTSQASIAVSSDDERVGLQRFCSAKVPIYAVQGGFNELECRRLRFQLVLDLSGRPVQVDHLECVSEYGQYIRVEEFNQESVNPNNIPQIPRNISYCTVTVESILTGQLERTASYLGSALRRSFESKSYQYWQSSSFPLSQVADALDHLYASASHDVVVEMPDSDEIQVVRHRKQEFELSTNGTYIIVGGFGDLGRSLARWMVARGAKNLAIISRSGPKTEDARQMVCEFEEKNVSLLSVECDLTNRQLLERRLKAGLEGMPPIKGCVQAAGVLKASQADITYQQMTLDDWKMVADSKTIGSWNLHELLPPGMDFFILIASVMGVIGQATQANYAAANAYQDALARYRVARGEKALSLDLGALLTGGLVSQKPDLLGRLTGSKHYISMTEEEIWRLMDLCCDPLFQHSPASAPQICTGVRSPAGCHEIGIPVMDAMRYPMWSALQPVKKRSEDESAGSQVADAYTLMKAAETQAAANEVAVQSVVQRLAAMLLIEASAINPGQCLSDNDVDSLCAIELRNWILNIFGIQVPMFDLLGGTTINELGCSIAEQ